MSVRVMSWVWEQSLPPNGKIILLALADHAHDDGRNAFPSLARIAKKTGYSERQVQRILSELVRQGAISVQEASTTTKPTVYAINISGDFVVGRADFHTGSASRELRFALMGRDALTCHHCARTGDEVCDPDGAPWEADRIIPGGEYTLENTVLSCRLCNRKRGRGDIMTTGGVMGDVEGGDTDVLYGATPMSTKPSIQPSKVQPPINIHHHRAVAEHFQIFWETYPRKVGKAAAEKAFRKAAAVVDPVVIIEGAVRYASDPNREDQFTAHPTTWLNAGRWDDEALPSRGRKSGTRAFLEASEALSGPFGYLELGAADESL